MSRLSGIWGEDKTRDVLRSAKRRGLILGWIDNLEIEGGDVDDLVVASWGAVAVDSKWHTCAFDEASIQRDCSRTLAATRRASLIMRSEGHPTELRTLVVVVGRNSSTCRRVAGSAEALRSSVAATSNVGSDLGCTAPRCIHGQALTRCWRGSNPFEPGSAQDRLPHRGCEGSRRLQVL